jgi:hypothetical protein
MENCTSFCLKFEIGQKKKFHTFKELWGRNFEVGNFKWWYRIQRHLVEFFCRNLSRKLLFLKMPDIILSVMQKTFKKCLSPMKVSRFLHIRNKNLSGVFKIKECRKSLAVSNGNFIPVSANPRLLKLFRTALLSFSTNHQI